MRDLKFKLSDTTLVSDVNQTLSNLLSQVNKTNKTVTVVSNKVAVNTKAIAAIPSPTTSGVAVGCNVADVPWNNWNRGSGSLISTAGFTWCQVQFANSIHFVANTWSISIIVTTVISAPITEFVVIRTLRDSLTVVDVTPITFGGSATPTFGTTGTKTSDPVSLPIDAQHDYYFCWTGNTFGGSGQIAGNTGSGSNPLFTSYSGNCNSATPRSSAWAGSIGAGGGFGTAFPLGSGSYFLTAWNWLS